jgi:hypothetical protein
VFTYCRPLTRLDRTKTRQVGWSREVWRRGKSGLMAAWRIETQHIVIRLGRSCCDDQTSLPLPLPPPTYRSPLHPIPPLHHHHHHRRQPPLSQTSPTPPLALYVCTLVTLPPRQPSRAPRAKLPRAHPAKCDRLLTGLPTALHGPPPLTIPTDHL